MTGVSASSSPLSTSDRQLLREVFAWGHTNGWSYTRSGRHYEFEHPKLGTVEASNGLRRINVYYWRDLGQHHVSFWPESVTEAVDVLCALGVLPAALSSAYAAGRGSVYDRAEYRVTTPDGQRPGSNWPIYSVVDAFKTLGFWRRNGWHDAYLERRWDKEPGEWERVSDQATQVVS